MSTKVSDQETGRKRGAIVQDPRWKCPSCKQHVSEPFALKCRGCKKLASLSPEDQHG